jgi:23S rRNA pseudouridine2605 synthase
MCEAIGHPVIRLVRTKIGPLADRSLAPGEWRLLAIDEVRALERAAGPETPTGTI